MQLTNKKIPPLTIWQEFESLCLDLFKKAWDIPDLKKHGRGGQNQSGVDIYGKRVVDGKITWIGLQCKCSQKLTEDILLCEIKRAKDFKPQLSEFYIIYTGPSDTNIQEKARLISEKNIKLKLFIVEVISWDDLTSILENYPDIFEKYYSYKILKTEIDAANLAELKDFIKSEGEKIVSSVEKVGHIQHFIEPESAITQEYNLELNYAKELIKDFKPETALDYLQNLKSRSWTSFNPNIKFRILTNMGSAYLTIGKEPDAAKSFIEALQYNKDDEKANSNVGLAKLIMGEKEDALKFAQISLNKNPYNDLAISLTIELAPDSEEIDSVTLKIPQDLLNNSIIAYSIGMIARKRKEFEKAIYWSKIAMENDKEGNPFFIEILGEIFFEMVISDKFSVLTDQLDNEQIENLKKAVCYFDLAWKKLKNDEIKKYKLDWLLNLSNARKILKDNIGAKEAIELALRFDTENIGLINQKAILEFESKNTPQAIAILKDKIDKSTESLFILSRIIIHTDSADEGLLKDLIDKTIELLKGGLVIKKYEFERTLIQLYLKSNDNGNALLTVDNLISSNPSNITLLIDKTKVLDKLSSDKNEQIIILQKAKEFINEDTSKQQLLDLAEAFYFYEDFLNALPLLEQVTDLNVESSLSNKLLACYFNLGEFKPVLETCERLQKKYGYNKFYTNMQVAIFNELGDIPGGIEICEKYLEIYPDDIDIKIAKEYFYYQSENYEELDNFLKQKIPLAKLSKDKSLLLVELLNKRNFKKEAFDLIYEIRRNFYSDGVIHLKYIGFFFLNSSQEPLSWLDVKEVDINTAVCLKEDNENMQWYIIENREESALNNNELYVDNDFAKKLLHKKVGDKVISGQFVISELKSKYVFALHESLKLMRTVFSNIEGIQSFKLDTPEDEQSFEKAFKPIALTLDEQEKVQKEAFNLYRNKKITLGMLSKFFSEGVLGAWSNLTGVQEYYLYCCDGNDIERTKALEMLAHKKEVAIDFISLLTLDTLNLKDLLISNFKALLISQSTFELLKSSIENLKLYEKKGRFSLGKQDGEYVKQEISPEQIGSHIEKLENLKDWVKKYCTVTPVKEILSMNANRISRLRNMIGSSFMDTILIAKEKDSLLYSDDFILRILAENEFGVGGIWTQVFLIFALNNSSLNSVDYKNATIRLALLNYRYTTINSDILLEAAKIAKWKWSEPYLSIVKILNGGTSSDQSSLIVARDFILKLFSLNIYTGNRNQLMHKIMDSITKNRDRKLVPEILINQFENSSLPANLIKEIKEQIIFWDFYCI